MNNSLKKFQAWRSRRQLRSLERWEQIRAEGKARFVVRTALTYGLTVVGLIHVSDQVFLDGAQPSISLFKLIVFVLVGVVGGREGWNAREAKYQKALHEARVQASASGALPPHNNALQITADSK